MTKLRRRALLIGAGGVAVGLPFLESVWSREARADDDDDALIPPYVIWFRKAAGVQQKLGSEPERFWPRQFGDLTAESTEGRAIEELSPYFDRLLALKNINIYEWGYGDGHANGCLQGLTGRGPLEPGLAGNSEASGESIDSKIARDLNPAGNDALFLYVGDPTGFIGGPCLSHRGPNNRRAAISNPITAYQTIMGLDPTQPVLLDRQQSVNDLVRDQMNDLMSSPKLSANDVQRLELHFDSIRDLEGSLACMASEDERLVIEGLAPGYESEDGDLLLAAVRAHNHVASLAVSCGYTRTVIIQIGSGSNSGVWYRDPDTGELMENYHYISHRRAAHAAGQGVPIEGADVMHHKCDRLHLRAFKHLLDLLDAHDAGDGGSVLDAGVSAFFSDIGIGLNHAPYDLPYLLAGNAGGFLIDGGKYINVEGGDRERLTAIKLINTLASAVGVRKGDGDLLDNWGDTTILPTGLLDAIIA